MLPVALLMTPESAKASPMLNVSLPLSTMGRLMVEPVNRRRPSPAGERDGVAREGEIAGGEFDRGERHAGHVVVRAGSRAAGKNQHPPFVGAASRPIGRVAPIVVSARPVQV